MTSKLLSLAGLLLLLHGPVFAEAAPATEAANETATSAPTTTAEPPAPPPLETRLAWQRVGAPIHLEG